MFGKHGRFRETKLKRVLAKVVELTVRTRPMGLAFLLAMMVLIVSGVLVWPLTPSEMTQKFTMHAIPEAYEHGVLGPPVDGQPLGAEFPGCRWRLHQDLAGKGLAGPPAPLSVVCRDYEAVDETGQDSSIAMSKKFRDDPQWKVAEHTHSVVPPQTITPFASAVYLALPLIVTIVLLRGLSMREDIIRAARVVARRPWVLAVVPLTMGIGGVVFNALLPARIDRLNEVMEAFQTIPAGAIAIVLVMPVFEEAVFRQWLYVRTIDRLPVWAVALGSSWFFMLSHIFNPQMIAAPGYLPTVFVGGLAFFWIRHRFGSFSLAALAHMLNNGIAFFLPMLLSG